MSLNKEQKERYARHIILPEVGANGQEKLLDSKVLIVGAGGLGSPATLYLAAAGIGTIGLVDPDTVDLTNLQRQVLHSIPAVGKPKIESAKNAVHALNNDVEVITYATLLTEANATEIIAKYDFIIDATDNFSSKFLIADVCHKTKTPYSHAGVSLFEGQTTTVLPGKSTCYRCIFNSPPPEDEQESSSQPTGILGVLPGVIGSIQATEAIKFLLGIGNCLTNRLLIYNSLSMKFREVKLKKNKNCPLCGQTAGIKE